LSRPQGDLEKSCKAAELHSLSAASNVIRGTLPSVQRSIHPTDPFMYADSFSQPPTLTAPILSRPCVHTKPRAHLCPHSHTLPSILRCTPRSLKQLHQTQASLVNKVHTWPSTRHRSRTRISFTLPPCAHSTTVTEIRCAVPLNQRKSNAQNPWYMSWTH
jgi:hypothetical protein